MASTSFASAMAVSSPSSVNVFTPISAPPFSASSLLSASTSPSSPTQGLHVVNQKLTTVTALPENSSSLFTTLPSRSLPSNAGNFCMLPSSGVMDIAPSAGMFMSLSSDICAASGYFSSSMVSLFSISLICAAACLSVSYSSSVN